jgi:hypothetical protein
MTTKLRVRFDGSHLIPLEPVDLPTGTELDVELSGPPRSASPSAQRLLDAIWSTPPIDAETMEAFRRALAEERVPSPAAGIFDDLIESGD